MGSRSIKKAAGLCLKGKSINHGEPFEIRILFLWNIIVKIYSIYNKNTNTHTKGEKHETENSTGYWKRTSWDDRIFPGRGQVSHGWAPQMRALSQPEGNSSIRRDLSGMRAENYHWRVPSD